MPWSDGCLLVCTKMVSCQLKDIRNCAVNEIIIVVCIVLNMTIHVAFAFCPCLGDLDLSLNVNSLASLV